MYNGPWDNPSARRLLGILGDVTQEPTGIPDPTELNLTWNDGTRTLTLTPTGATFRVYVRGVLYDKVTETIVIPDTEGLWWVYYNSTGTLTSSQSPPASFYGNAIVWAGYWDATNNAMLLHSGNNELHDVIMPGSTHKYLHDAFHTQWDNGLAFGNMTVDGDGSSNTHITLGVSNGEIHDEDKELTITNNSPQQLSTQLSAPVLYLEGADPVWRKQAAGVYPVISYSGGSGLLAYNQYTGGAWQQTEVVNGRYVLVHIFATNDAVTPIVAVQGQNEYLNKPQASIGAENEMSTLYLTLGGLPISEWIPLGTIIAQTSTSYTNTKKARFVTDVDGSYYLDWRRIKIVGRGAELINAITQGDSNVAVNDGGTGYVDVTIDNTFICRVKKSGSNLYITNPVTSGQIFIEGVDAGTDDSTMIGLNPDGAVAIYHNGTLKYSSDADGLLLNDGACIEVDPTPGVDHGYTGKMALKTVDANATGFGALLYIAADGNLEEADADAIATMLVRYMALETGTGSKKVLLEGYVRDDSWSWATLGAPLYASTTAGAITDTAPSGASDIVQSVGWVESATIIYFRPSLDYATV